MHELSTSFVLGFHGCASETAEALVAGATLEASTNDYDWLGHGVYFWENDPDRARAFVIEKFKRENDSRAPAVVGAIIDLGLCLDMTTRAAAKAIRVAHQVYLATLERAGRAPPSNEGGPDRLRRKLDCAVINYLHQARNAAKEPSVDTVRGVFIEGEPVYDGAGFFEKTHIQIAVRNPDCIKGIFLPR